MPSKEPRPASHFRLDLGGRQGVGMFRECSGLDSETSVIEHKSIDDNGRPVVRKVPGEIKWSNITLKRGVDSKTDLWQWRAKVIEKGAEDARVDGTIEIVDYAGSALATYAFKQGWPIKYVGSALNAGGNEVAVEELHIAHEGLERK
jgi:phage tail-like protein